MVSDGRRYEITDEMYVYIRDGEKEIVKERWSDNLTTKTKARRALDLIKYRLNKRPSSLYCDHTDSKGFSLKKSC